MEVVLCIKATTALPKIGYAAQQKSKFHIANKIYGALKSEEILSAQKRLT
jgi:hypothetical protein